MDVKRLVMRGVLVTAVALGGFTAVACGGGEDEGDAAAATTEAAVTATAEEHEDDSDDLIKGLAPKDFYNANCATCHGPNREGGVGLPLTPQSLTNTDEFYADTIKNGRAGTGMTMMGTILGMSDEEIATLVEFLKTDQP
ncbi:MAG: hypothetical protein AMXMBFR23_20630 [Chloroflexota bacterium]